MKFRIREIRKERGWTIDHLAEVTAYSRGYISQLETGQRQPSVEMLETLAHAFGLTVPDLYADNDLAQHLQIMRGLSPKDQEAVVQHALALAQKAAE